MTHPEINLSWVCLFLNPKGTLKNAENADSPFFISENQRSSASKLNSGLIMLPDYYTSKFH